MPADVVVTRCMFDYRFTIQLLVDQLSVDITIESGFMFMNGEGNHQLDSEQHNNLGRCLAVLHKSVQQVIMHKSGLLEVKVDAISISVPPDANHEAWQVSVTNGLRVIAMPGGALAVWSPDDEPEERKMGLSAKRQLIEKIIAAEGDLQLSRTDLTWLTTPHIVAYTDALYDLYLDYYSKQADDVDVVDVEVLSSYLTVTRILNDVLRDARLQAFYRQAQETLTAIEGIMDQIIAEGFVKLNDADE
ncbi:MAG: DUF6188 family protein [Chloroflexota bacterium]